MKLTQFTKKCAYTTIPAITLALMVPFTAQATNGYFAHGYGVKHKGMAGVGVASPQGTLSTATNPAVMQSLGDRLDFGADYFQPMRDATTRYDNVNHDGDGDSAFLIPEFGYSNTINNDMSWGVAVYGNGGMNTRYASAPYASTTGTNTGVDLAQLFIAPTFAMKVNENHTFGVSLNLIYQTFEAYGLENFAPFTPDSNTANLTDEGKDTSTGYSVKVGWLGKISDAFTLGVAYQTRSEMSEFTKYHDLFAEQGDFDIPSNWTIGLKFAATPKMNVMFDVQQINYSEVASIANPNGTGNGTGALGESNGRGFGWDDMTVYKLGMDYQIAPSFQLRVGYSITDQPIGADDTSFNLVAPAVIEEHITLGGTYVLENKSELSFFFMHALENTVNGNTNVNGQSGSANLTMSQNSMGLAYGWKF